MATNEQKTREILKIFGTRIRGDITEAQLEDKLRLSRAGGILDEDVVVTLDNSLAQTDEQSPNFATAYRLMSLSAARIVGVPHLIGNAAFSASKVAWLIDKNVKVAIRCSVESVEAYARAQGAPPESLARSFRNLARMFHLATASDLKELESDFQRILAVAESLENKGFDAVDVAACIDPLIDCFSYLTSIGLNRSYFSRLHQLAK